MLGLSLLVSRLSPLDRVARDVTAVLVIGLFQTLSTVSLAALVFSGDLSVFVGRGVGFALVGAVVAAAVVALTTTLPGTVGGSQNSTGAILAVIAANASLAVGAGVSDEARFATVMVAIALATLSTGAFLVVLGRFGLGDLVRFLPQPVVGGFLAGTGWLISIGAVGMMAGGAPPLWRAWLLFEPATLALWLPGLLLALILMFAVGRSDHYLVLPSVIVAATSLFILAARFSDTSVAALGAGGWLLGPFASDEVWRPLGWREVREVRWEAVLGQVPAIAALWPVTAMAVLLNGSGLSVARQQEVDPRRELRSAGMASMLSGAVGGLVGYQQLGVSLLAMRLRARSRGVAVAAAAVTGLALFVEASLLSMVPRFVLGGLLLYIGLGFLKGWMVDSWGRLPPLDYAVMTAIVATIATIGFLEGVGVGVVAAIVLFVVTYSRVDVVRHEMSGAHATSRVSRSPRRARALRARAEELHVLQLHGFLFFGTGHMLLERVRTRLEGTDLRFLLLDFRRVTGLDSTAALSFAKMHRAARSRGVTLVFTAVPDAVRRQLVRSGIGPDDGVRYLPDQDQGLEWCENRLLDEDPAAAAENASLEEHLSPFLEDESTWHRIVPYLQRQALAAGERLVAEGDPPDRLFVVASGTLTARLERPGRAPLRLQTMGGGNVLGELGFFLDRPRSASVVADVASVVWVLERGAYEHMADEDPSAALALQRLLLRLSSARVRHLMGVVQALER